MDKVKIIKGGMAIDDRGEVGFVNDFDFGGIKRFYTVTNHSKGFVRAWHSHRRESKYITTVKGMVLVCTVTIDDWEQPSKDLNVERFVLSETQPSIIYIPPGFAHGTMSLTDNAKIIVFSDRTLNESLGDDIRFPARYWNPWCIEER